jgi:hypothetical protein
MAWEQRIEQLSAQNKPKWGMMSVAQMLAHCQRPLEIALGDEPAKTKFLNRLSGPFKKLKYTSKKAKYPRNTRTPRIFRVTDEGLDFFCEKTRLLVFLRRFSEKGHDGKLVDRHPVFGWMTQRDWDLTQQKHLDHHLRQFGV